MALGITLAKLIVPIESKTDQFQSGISKAQGLVQGFVGSTQAAGKAIIAGMGVGLTSAAAGAAALGGAMLKLAADAAPLENVRAAFDGISESVGMSGDAMLEAFDKATVGMVSHEDAMMSFNKAAQLVGEEFAVQLPDAMGYLGKVAAATGQDMGFMLDSLVVGVGRLSPMILDNLGIQVTLAEATERAAEMFGVEASELTKAQQQAGMMNVVLDKLAQNTAAMPDITQSAAAKMEQLKVSLKNTKDEIGLALVPALGKLFDVFQPIISRALPAIVKLVETKLVPAIEKAVGWIGTIVEILFEWFNQMKDGTQPIEALGWALMDLGFETIGEQVMRVGQAFGAVFDLLSGNDGGGGAIIALQNLGKMMGMTNTEARELALKIKEVIDKIRDIITPIIDWVKGNVELQDILGAVAVLIASVVIPALVSIVTAAAPIVLAVAAVIAIVAVLRQVWEDHSEEIKAIADRVWGWLSTFIPQAIEKIKEVIQNVLAAIRQFWDEHGEQIMAGVSAFWETLKTVVETVINIVKGIIETVLNIVRQLWENHGDKVKGLVEAAWEFIQAVVDRISKIIQGIISMFQSDDESNWSGWKETISAIIDAAWTIINVLFDTALTALTTLFNIFSALFKGDWDALWEAVKTYFDTIWNGIKTIFSTIIDLIKQLWDTWSGDFGDNWDAFWSGVGDWFENVWQGIKDFVDRILSGIQDAWDGFKRSIQPIIDAVVGFFQGFVDIINAISSAIETAIGWIQSILDWLNQLLSVTLPSWLTGLSPPPLANWLMYIAEAAEIASKALGEQLTVAVGDIRGLPELATLPVPTSYDNSRTYNVTLAQEGKEATDLYDGIFILDGMI